jgi:hypothetical protein
MVGFMRDAALMSYYWSIMQVTGEKITPPPGLQFVYTQMAAE